MTGAVAAGLLALVLVGCGPKQSTGDSAAGDSAAGSAGASSSGPSTTDAPAPSHAASPSGSPSGGAVAPGEPTPPQAQTVVLEISGGFVGRKDTVTVEPDGSWTFVDGRKGVTRHGHLTAAQRARLTRLVHDPRLAAEARRKAPKVGCADGLSYRLRAGSLSIARADCGPLKETPVFNDVIALLTAVMAK